MNNNIKTLTMETRTEKIIKQTILTVLISCLTILAVYSYSENQKREEIRQSQGYKMYVEMYHK